MDYYKTLGIDKKANTDAVKKAYRRLASKHHPDKGGDEEIFKEIKEAYECLRDPIKKSEYDYQSTKKSHVRGTQYHEYYDSGARYYNKEAEDLKDHIRNRYEEWMKRGQKNKTIHIAMQIKLEDTLEEQTKYIEPKISTEILNPVKIIIPRGVPNGHTIRYYNVGSKKNTYAPQGDIIIEFIYAPHLRFEIVKGTKTDLECSVVISAFDAILGTKIPVTTIDGSTLIVTVPRGSQPGTRLKIPKRGLYQQHYQARGSLFVVLNVIIPTLSAKEEQIIRNLNDKE